jgi:hypothetical protein
MSRPDAIWMPESVKGSGKLFQRADNAATIAERWLEVDRATGERVYMRKQKNGRLFVTRDPYDTILFPTGHPHSGLPRYRWEKREGGGEVGWLVE